jgi:hypothetical protein
VITHLELEALEVKVHGERVSPATVRLNDLFELLKKIQDAVGVAATGRESPEDGEGFSMNLVAIAPGSLSLALTAPPWSRQGMEKVLNAIRDGNPDFLPLGSRRALASVSKQVEKKEWAVSLRGAGLEPVEISKSRPFPDPDANTVSGTTTIYGVCLRSGGVKDPGVMIRPVNGGKVVLAEADKSIAIALGKRLYEWVVGLEGLATWRLSDWEMVRFKATRILDYQEIPPAEAIKGLAEASGGYFDGLDVEKHLAGLFDEDEE